jgi:4-hydroxybenzoate polyprenyltransferase
MPASGAITLTRRPRWRAFLLLARISNVPTVWSNVAAGAVGGAAAAVPPALTAWTAVAASLFYTGGMFLNDAFDASFDRTSRPERPIPNGDVSRQAAFTAGAALLLGGLLLLAGNRRALLYGIMLAAAIVLYDMRHKGHSLAPLVMGACRGLVYLVAATAVGTVTTVVIAGAAFMTLYVAGLTVVAKKAGPDARWLVPALIAAVSIIDAGFILLVAPYAWPVAVLAATACPVTLALQRWVPGD